MKRDTKNERKRKINKLIKGNIRQEIIEQGAYDGRFREKVIPNKKKKYNRQRAKKVQVEEWKGD